MTPSKRVDVSRKRLYERSQQQEKTFMKDVQVISTQSRQSFDESEKRRIVEEANASSLSKAQFAKRMGISPATLCIWRKQLKKTSRTVAPAPSALIAFPSTLDGLHRENEVLRTENGELKRQVTALHAFVGRKIYEFELARSQ